MALVLEDATCEAATACGQRRARCYMDARGRVMCAECWLAIHEEDPS